MQCNRSALPHSPALQRHQIIEDHYRLQQHELPKSTREEERRTDQGEWYPYHWPICALCFIFFVKTELVIIISWLLKNETAVKVITRIFSVIKKNNKSPTRSMVRKYLVIILCDRKKKAANSQSKGKLLLWLRWYFLHQSFMAPSGYHESVHGLFRSCLRSWDVKPGCHEYISEVGLTPRLQLSTLLKQTVSHPTVSLVCHSFSYILVRLCPLSQACMSMVRISGCYLLWNKTKIRLQA